MWQLKTQFIAAVIFLASLCESQVTLDLCQPQILGSFCQVSCQTPDLAQDVVFRKDGTEYASCKIVFGSKQCSTIGSGYTIGQFSNSASSITRVNITQVSRAQDDGVWTCQYGGSTTSSKTFTVLTEPSGTNIITRTGDSSLNYCEINNTNSYVTVQFTVSCSSQVDIKAVFAMSGNIYHTEDLTVSKGPACTDIKENTYSAEYNITHIDTLSGGPYSLSFKTQLSGVNGKEFETKSNSTYTFSCPPTTTVPPTTTTPKPGPPKIIIYIIIGVVVAAVIIVAFIVYCVWQKRKQKLKKKEKNETSPGDSISAEANGKDLENLKSNTENTDSEINYSNL